METSSITTLTNKLQDHFKFGKIYVSMEIPTITIIYKLSIEDGFIITTMHYTTEISHKEIIDDFLIHLTKVSLKDIVSK